MQMFELFSNKNIQHNFTAIIYFNSQFYLFNYIQFSNSFSKLTTDLKFLIVRSLTDKNLISQ